MSTAHIPHQINRSKNADIVTPPYPETDIPDTVRAASSRGLRIIDLANGITQSSVIGAPAQVLIERVDPIGGLSPDADGTIERTVFIPPPVRVDLTHGLTFHDAFDNYKSKYINWEPESISGGVLPEDVDMRNVAPWMQHVRRGAIAHAGWPPRTSPSVSAIPVERRGWAIELYRDTVGSPGSFVIFIEVSGDMRAKIVNAYGRELHRHRVFLMLSAITDGLA